MENMVTADFWKGRRVFLTGHTGFKGSWLAIWLHRLGARVSGYALAPATAPSLFETAAVAGCLETTTIADVRDSERLAAALTAAAPEFVFHLAAQALVGEGYNDPVGTYASNVMGTAHLLQAIRHAPSVRAVVVVTSDKCYENRETSAAYREDAPLGGHDPYSSSKACVEILTRAWQRSFFSETDSPRIATARAGNVIGGGDWSNKRLVPDILAAFSAGQQAELRWPDSVRPWQHVLEPLAGYLSLAHALATNGTALRSASAWNFGPSLDDCVTAGQVADWLAAAWPGGGSWRRAATEFPHEARLLHLDASAAQRVLKWQPRWPLTEALQRTLAWHKAWFAGDNMLSFCRRQIDDYIATPTDAFPS